MDLVLSTDLLSKLITQISQEQINSTEASCIIIQLNYIYTVMDGCCPSPDYPVIQPTSKTSRQRLALQAIMYGEIGAALGRAYVFGFMVGVMHMISMWIDYMGYATMHYCQVLVIAICGGIEAMMLFINLQDGGPLQAAINRSSLTMFIFYVMTLFAITKMFAAGKIQESYKLEHERQITGSLSIEGDEYYQSHQDVEMPQEPPRVPHQQQYQRPDYANMTEEELQYQLQQEEMRRQHMLRQYKEMMERRAAQGLDQQQQ